MSSNSSVEKQGLGNTKPNPRQIVPSKKWCFTLHKYDDEDLSSISSRFKVEGRYWIYSEEVGESKETPHLQGYVEFKRKIRPLSLCLNDKIHWEKAKGNKEQNKNYIRKEGGKIYSNEEMEEEIETLMEDELYDWEKDIIEIVNGKPHKRKIHWYWEAKGGIGKSEFTKYLCIKHRAVVLSNKATDMKNQILMIKDKSGVYPKLIVIDIPRSINSEYISYTGIEEVKNGCFFSPKYEGGQVIMNRPHIIVFANREPDYEKMSSDKWDVREL